MYAWACFQRISSMKGRKNNIVLSDDERKQLLKLSRKSKTPHRLIIRAKLILMAYDGTPHKKIAAKFEMQPESVTRWVKRWNGTSNQEGKDVASRLDDAQRSGAPDTFTPEQKCRIVSIACEKPEVYEKPITQWTNKELADETIRQGIVRSISSSQVGRILKKTMYALIK